MGGPVFNDALIYYGRKQYKKSCPLEKTLAEMKSEDISSAVAVSFEQFYEPPDMSNEKAQRISAENKNIYHLIAMAPSVTGELKKPADYLNDKTAGFLLSPLSLHIPARPVFLKEWLSFAEERRVPVWYTAGEFEYAADVLAAFNSLYGLRFTIPPDSVFATAIGACFA